MGLFSFNSFSRVAIYLTFNLITRSMSSRYSCRSCHSASVLRRRWSYVSFLTLSFCISSRISTEKDIHVKGYLWSLRLRPISDFTKNKKNIVIILLLQSYYEFIWVDIQNLKWHNEFSCPWDVILYFPFWSSVIHSNSFRKSNIDLTKFTSLSNSFLMESTLKFSSCFILCRMYCAKSKLFCSGYTLQYIGYRSN